MWLVGNKNKNILDVYLSSHGFSVCQAGAFLHAHNATGLDATLGALEAWLPNAPPAKRGQLHLSATLCRPFLMKALPPLSPNEAEAAKQAAARKRTGLTGPCRIWVDGPSVSGPAVAAAVEQSLLDRVQALVAQAGRRLRWVSVQPMWAEWLRAGLKSKPAATCVVLHESDAVTVLGGAGGRFELATSITTSLDGPAGRDIVARLLLGADFDTSAPQQARVTLHPKLSGTTVDSELNPLIEVLE